MMESWHLGGEPRAPSVADSAVAAVPTTLSLPLVDTTARKSKDTEGGYIMLEVTFIPGLCDPAFH